MFLDTDKQLTLFSSEGKLSQCDNALVASTKGSMALGCCSVDGVVLVSLKECNDFVVLNEYRKVYKISNNIGCTYSGLQPDFRIQYNMGIKIAEDYYDVYNTNIPVKTFVETFSRQVQEYTIKKGYRPFGTLILISGDNMLYRIDPSGSYTSIDIASIGKDYVESGTLLRKRRGMLDDNISTCVVCIREYAGKSITSSEVDIGVYEDSTKTFRLFTVEEVKEVFDSINKV